MLFASNELRYAVKRFAICEADLSVRLTQGLVRKLEKTHNHDFVEVIVELDPATPIQGSSHAATIAARKNAFEAAFAVVERVITNVGGTVLGKVWLNESIQARIPAGQIDQVASLKSVRTVDTPRHITIE